MKLMVIGLTLLFLFNACNHEKKQEQQVMQPYQYKSLLDNHDLINRLQDSATQYGNNRAYGELSSSYELENMNPELLYYGMIMANKYDNAEGYYHVFASLSSPNTGETLNQLDKRTRSLAIYYLLKSYELGEESAKYKVDEIFGKKIPKSSYYLQEFVKAELAPITTSRKTVPINKSSASKN